ncbi:DNA polymerase IV [Acinetobacter seifertii]|uniref:DNA polymerase IV n=1 Tax=Acinetobacter seifertii TaxID=1530123 RepID=UPI000D3D4B7D|nr:DNA polymerase IV [Acinetobacter seifertii]PTV59199.1 DNA polymerase IV [Acinetobacter seifertii]
MRQNINIMKDVTEYCSTRKIIHIDMDCFYAQVEERNHPELKNLPIIIGGPTPTRGVVCTANYIAREFGVGAGQSTYEAFKKCPNLRLIHPNFKLYKAISADIRKIFEQYTHKVQSIGLDEAYLDVTDVQACHGSATLVAQQIMSDIWNRTQLTCSAGVSFNKLIAKIASDWNKPNGLCVVPPDQRLDFMRSVPVLKIPSIGPKSARLLKSINLTTAQDVIASPLPILISILGVNKAIKIYQACHGVCHAEVEPFRLRQTFTSETTYYEPINFSGLVKAIDDLSVLFHHTFSALDPAHFYQRTITKAVLKFRDEHFNTKTKTIPITEEESRNLIKYRAWSYKSLKNITEHFEVFVNKDARIRLLGIGVRFKDSYAEQFELKLLNETY